MPRRLLMAVTTAAALIALTAPPAFGVSPAHGSYLFEMDATTSDICPFDVDVHYDIQATYTQFFDQAGNQTQWIEQDLERDTFRANGKTLVGLPFRYSSQFRMDAEGNLVSYTASGGIERVPLPDGSVFWSAGRFDWIAAHVTFTITPTVGHSGDVEAFCKALS